jgi:PKD repeat protein
VTLDVSQTTLTDKDDEIVSFTWDFGDGEIKKNINQGKVVYTYRFDTVKESGEYTPKVTIKTKKGLQETIVNSTPILVKRATRTLRIVSDTHPGQLA